MKIVKKQRESILKDRMDRLAVYCESIRSARCSSCEVQHECNQIAWALEENGIALQSRLHDTLRVNEDKIINAIIRSEK